MDAHRHGAGFKAAVQLTLPAGPHQPGRQLLGLLQQSWQHSQHGCCLHMQAEAVQRELDRLGFTLKQIEAYNESMKGEIAVTRRAAYAAEEAVQKLEKEKLQQDYLIDDLQVIILYHPSPQCITFHIAWF